MQIERMSRQLAGKIGMLHYWVRPPRRYYGLLTDRIAVKDCVSATLSSRNSLLLPCDSSTRVLELLVLLDQHWSYSRLKYPICLLSRSGQEMLTFVRSMMEWLGGTVSKEDVGGEGHDGKGGKGHKRKRDDDNDEDALGAFALRFKYVLRRLFCSTYV